MWLPMWVEEVPADRHARETVAFEEARRRYMATAGPGAAFVRAPGEAYPPILVFQYNSVFPHLGKWP